MSETLEDWLREAAAIAGTPEWLMACARVEQMLKAGEAFADVRFEQAAFAKVAAARDLSDAAVTPLADDAFIARASQLFASFVQGQGDELTKVLAATALLLLRDRTLMARMVYAAQLAEHSDDGGLSAVIELAGSSAFLHLDELLRLHSLWVTYQGREEDRVVYVQQHLDEGFFVRLKPRLSGALAAHFERHPVLVTLGGLRAGQFVKRADEPQALLDRCWAGDEEALMEYILWLADHGLSYEATQLSHTRQRLRLAGPRS